MDNSGVSESTEISHEIPDTQHTSGVATSERNNDQTVHDIENQNVQEVVVELDPPIVTGASFNQQQHPVQDIENSNLEEARFSLEVKEAILASFTGDDGSKRNENAESMYEAALKGDWTAAEEVLRRDPKLACDRITEGGDRALHVAAAREHEEFVWKLVEMMSPSDLELLDGRGYTACCYAAISGSVEIALVMIQKNPNLATAHDGNKETPLRKAAIHGNKEMVSYFMKYTEAKDLSEQEWFDLLLVTIRSRMYDVAIEILRKDGSLATMENDDEGTALHLLARQNMSNLSWLEYILLYVSHKNPYLYGIDPPVFNKLAENLWAEMQTRLEKPRLLQLMKEHHIVHDAVKTGHVELVTMLIRTYPQLIWDTDSNGYTIFHIAVKYRQQGVFNLIHQLGLTINLSAASQDQDGNNILHLAAKLAPPDRVKTLESHILMRRELTWFKQTKEMVPPSCEEMRNANGLTPRDLFSEEHKSLLESSKAGMRKTADSLMLIATILLTVVFAATFSVPGGYDSQTGKPILIKKHRFDQFLGYEAVSLAASVISITMFRSIMASNFAEDDFLLKLPLQLMVGLEALGASLLCAHATFFRSFNLVNGKTQSVTAWSAYYISSYFCYFWLIIESPVGMLAIIDLLRRYLFRKNPARS